MSNTVDVYPAVLGIDEPGHAGYPADVRLGYRERGVWSGRTLPAELIAAADNHQDLRALVTPEGEWTYRVLYDTATRLARGLLSSTGLRPGDAVMFQMGNVAETVVAYLACLLAGFRPVCTLPQHGEREVGLLAKHVGAKGLFVQADFGRPQRLREQAESLRGAGCGP